MLLAASSRCTGLSGVSGMETVQIAVSDHQWPVVVIVLTVLVFVAGWAVFAWSR